jgi:hypothetical protein
MKAGESVYLHQNPTLRGNISKVTPEGVYVTWHKYVFDVPEALSPQLKVNVREGSKRMRVFYPTREHPNLGVGTP